MIRVKRLGLAGWPASHSAGAYFKYAQSVAEHERETVAGSYKLTRFLDALDDVISG